MYSVEMIERFVGQYGATLAQLVARGVLPRPPAIYNEEKIHKVARALARRRLVNIPEITFIELRKPGFIERIVNRLGTQVGGSLYIAPIVNPAIPLTYVVGSDGIFHEMQCPCGTLFGTSTTSLRRKNLRCPACVALDEAKQHQHVQQRYGQLTTLKRDPDDVRKLICQCDCGVVKSVFTSALSSGCTKSCGCLRRSRLKPKEAV